MEDLIKITHCARCRDLFVKIRFDVCEKCIDEEEEDYQRIHDVLAEDASQSTEAVALLAGVDVACVLRMLDRGLIVNDHIAREFKCGRCGETAISATQKLCRSCLHNLDREFFQEINEAKRVLSAQRRESVHTVLTKKRQQTPNINSNPKKKKKKLP